MSTKRLIERVVRGESPAQVLEAIKPSKWVTTYKVNKTVTFEVILSPKTGPLKHERVTLHSGDTFVYEHTGYRWSPIELSDGREGTVDMEILKHLAMSGSISPVGK